MVSRDGTLSACDLFRPCMRCTMLATVSSQKCSHLQMHLLQTLLRWQVEPVPGWERRSPVMVDAPVSGGVVGAQAATLTFMVRLLIRIPSACARTTLLILTAPTVSSLRQATAHRPEVGRRTAVRLRCTTMLAVRRITSGVQRRAAAAQPHGRQSDTLRRAQRGAGSEAVQQPRAGRCRLAMFLVATTCVLGCLISSSIESTSRCSDADCCARRATWPCHPCRPVEERLHAVSTEPHAAAVQCPWRALPRD